MKKLLNTYLSILIFSIFFFGIIPPTPGVKAISDLNIEINPKICGQKADYRFSFALEKTIMVHQWIKFNFPKGSLLSPPIPENNEDRIERLKEIGTAINFCGSETPPPQGWDPCKSLPIIEIEKDSSLTIKINSWLELDPSKEGYKDICMKISKEAGLVLPSQPGNYTFKVASQSEPAFIESPSIEITEKTEPFDDNTPPIIEIDSPANESETRENVIQVKGRVYDLESGIEKLNISGNVANIVESDGSLIFDWILARSKNTVEITAINGVGLSTSQQLTVTNLAPEDTTPPIIMINSPAEGSETRENQIHVNATVMDPESGVAEIKIIGNTLNITENKGTVDFDWNLTIDDKNYVDIIATNGAGLSTTKRLTVFKRPPEIEGPKTVIELWIGKKTAIVDRVTLTLDVPPQIVRGRTVVPLRFIAEAFKAKVDYDAPNRTIFIVFGEIEIVLEINNSEATMLVPIEGKKVIKIVMLDTPPFIQNGRTLVPVRFIAEAFGARVDWDSKTQKITITLKK